MTRRKLHELLGTRWGLDLLTALAAAPLRSNELRSRLAGLSGRMQAKTLRQLADAGLVARDEVAAGARRREVTYSLTATGREALAWSALPLEPSLESKKNDHLQDMGRAMLDEWLGRVTKYQALPDNTAQDLCQRLSQELDSPFEDCQPTAPLLALIGDWLERQR